jgi:hypothetical protein
MKMTLTQLVEISLEDKVEFQDHKETKALDQSLVLIKASKMVKETKVREVREISKKEVILMEVEMALPMEQVVVLM